jgi:hypothetical protein
MVSQNYSTHCSGEGLTGGESRWQIGQQCKNESAPDSIESGRPSISPPPKAAHNHRMLYSSLEEWLQ